MTASMMEEIHATWLYEALKMSWMSLKKTVMALGNAYENPMEMNDPKTTAHPQPPSGGATGARHEDGGGITGPPQSRLFTGNDRTRGTVDFH